LAFKSQCKSPWGLISLAKPIGLFNFSLTLVYPPPMNVKRWMVQSERLFNFHDLGQSLQLANEK
jgi:hypothetical protein